MTAPNQTFATHRRLVPSFHIVLFFMLVANFVFSIVHLYRHHTYEAAMGVVLAIAFGLFFYHLRSFVTTLQDRIIRLEEMVRYERCLPADLAGRAARLSLRQMIGLRFASDVELPALVGKALDSSLGEKTIKQQVTSWRADHLRV